MIPDPHSVYRHIGQLIKARRKKLGLKQESLASTIGISRGSLANIETGRQKILVHKLYDFADALGLRPIDLLPSPQSSAPVRATRGGGLPLPSHLNQQQRKQVANLFMIDDDQHNTTSGETHAKDPRN